MEAAGARLSGGSGRARCVRRRYRASHLARHRRRRTHGPPDLDGGGRPLRADRNRAALLARRRQFRFGARAGVQLDEIGRASWRERGGQHGVTTVGRVTLKKNNTNIYANNRETKYITRSDM